MGFVEKWGVFGHKIAVLNFGLNDRWWHGGILKGVFLAVPLVFYVFELASLISLGLFEVEKNR